MLRSSFFIVRVWRQRDRGGTTAFRASVRAVNAERDRMFTRPSDVARYLVRNCPDDSCGRGDVDAAVELHGATKGRGNDEQR